MLKSKSLKYNAIVCAMFLVVTPVFAQTTFNLSPEMFGAKGDAAVISNGNMIKGSAKLTCANGKFSYKDIHKIFFVNGAALSDGTLIGTVDSVISTDVVILNQPALTTVASATVTYGTDCTEAFIKINSAARGIKNKTVDIIFSRGIYLTKFNNWLAGIKNVSVFGDGASIMCTNGAYSPNGFPTANAALIAPDVFGNVDNNYYSGKWAANTSYGFKINTAKALDNYITLRIADSAVNFKTGDWALVYGFEEENVGGYPPDARYFEYAKIIAVDKSTGKITFAAPLKKNYDDGWPDSTWTGGIRGIGAPRIINCNRATFNIIENLVMKDLNFLSFPGWVSKYATRIRNGRLQFYGCINAEIINVHCTGLYIGTSKNIVFRNCEISDEDEPDKEVENLTFDRCNIHKIVSARGIDTLRVINTIFTGEFTVSPRVLFVNGCHFSTIASGSSVALAHFGFNGGTDLIKIGTNIWIGNDSDTKRTFLLGPGGVTVLKVEKILNNNTITVSNSNWSDARNGRQVVPSHTGYSSKGKTFTVTRVFQYQKGVIAVEGIFSSAPDEGDAFAFSYIPKVIIEEKQVITGKDAEKYKLFANEKNINDLKDLSKQKSAP